MRSRQGPRARACLLPPAQSVTPQRSNRGGVMTETRRIADITIGKRHRKDLGDIDGLAASIRDIGLLHPVVIRSDGKLIAGERRLEACRWLGWEDVPVTVVDLEQVIRGELAENAIRKDFLPSEIDAIRRALEPIEKAAAKERQGERVDR